MLQCSPRNPETQTQGHHTTVQERLPNYIKPLFLSWYHILRTPEQKGMQPNLQFQGHGAVGRWWHDWQPGAIHCQLRFLNRAVRIHPGVKLHMIFMVQRSSACLVRALGTAKKLILHCFLNDAMLGRMSSKFASNGIAFCIVLCFVDGLMLSRVSFEGPRNDPKFNIALYS